jgi:hypothetical protein
MYCSSRPTLSAFKYEKTIKEYKEKKKEVKRLRRNIKEQSKSKCIRR